MSDTESSSVAPVRWIGGLDDGYLEMLDQSERVEEDAWLVMADAGDVVDHVADGAIREAPALGTAAAYAVALIGRQAALDGELEAIDPQIEALDERLDEERPEVVDLRWALDRMREVVGELDPAVPETFVERLFEEAQKVATELHTES